MKKQNAINAIKFLDMVPIKGHQLREDMNEVCKELLDIVNAKEPKPDQDKDAKADAK